jgi:hypothetical protein
MTPLLVLAGISLAVSALVSSATGGQEIADDAPHFLEFARSPLVLWESYKASGMGSQWGSFPPLLPLLFGSPIRPWTAFLPDFWAIRVGVLTWTWIVGLGLLLVLVRVERLPRPGVRLAVWSFALLPSVWGAVAMIPQEEIYVAGFVLATYAAARTGRWGLVGWLLILTALAAKYFVLIMLVPLALASPRPIWNAGRWGAGVAAALLAYVAYHKLRWDLMPIWDYTLSPSGYLSMWSLLWELGVQPPVRLIGFLGTGLTSSGVLAMCLVAWRQGVPLPYMMAMTLYGTLLTISITAPAYALWAAPIALICVARTRDLRTRVLTLGLMVAWAGAEWGVNFSRGVALALGTPRGPAKSAIAAAAQRLLGEDFPFSGVQLALLFAISAIGLALVAVMWRGGLVELTGQGPAEEGGARNGT